MSLLQIVQDAALRVGLAQPVTAISATDQTVQQLVAYAQDAGDDMQERWQWLNQKKSGTFTGDGVTTLFTPPTNFGTLSPSITFVSSIYPTLTLPGPVNEDDLLRMKALPVVVQPSCWRRINGQIEFFPALASGEIITYTYHSKLWITDSTGVTFRTRWLADTDIAVFSERLVMLGTIWMWKRGKGLDYAEEFAAYERALDRNAGQENQGREINTAAGFDTDISWPGTIAAGYVTP